jgi:hypothetical protein
MPLHKKPVRENEELNCLEIDLTQGQVGLISHESKWVLDKFNFYAHWKPKKKDYYVRYNDEHGKMKSLHQLLMDFPAYPKLQVDHLNGNPRDNRLSNLRVVTHSQNQRNTKLKNKFGVHGIRYDENLDKYTAEIWNNNGKKLICSRACKKHGREQALELVKKWRKQKEKEFGNYL